MILRVFWGRLIRMVGPRAAATATPVVVVTNSRRSMLLRLVIEMPSNELKDAVSGVKPRGTRHPTPSTCRYRSEEHTSELQSQSNLVCRLLLEKKKKKKKKRHK